MGGSSDRGAPVSTYTITVRSDDGGSALIEICVEADTQDARITELTVRDDEGVAVADGVDFDLLVRAVLPDDGDPAEAERVERNRSTTGPAAPHNRPRSTRPGNPPGPPNRRPKVG